MDGTLVADRRMERSVARATAQRETRPVGRSIRKVGAICCRLETEPAGPLRTNSFPAFYRRCPALLRRSRVNLRPQARALCTRFNVTAFRRASQECRETPPASTAVAHAHQFLTSRRRRNAASRFSSISLRSSLASLLSNSTHFSNRDRFTSTLTQPKSSSDRTFVRFCYNVKPCVVYFRAA